MSDAAEILREHRVADLRDQLLGLILVDHARATPATVWRNLRFYAACACGWVSDEPDAFSPWVAHRDAEVDRFLAALLDAPPEADREALRRLAEFAEAYPKRRGLDPDMIYALDGGIDSGGTECRLSDLRALLADGSTAEPDAALRLTTHDELTREFNSVAGTTRCIGGWPERCLTRATYWSVPLSPMPNAPGCVSHD
jgi:hypothetical protein